MERLIFCPEHRSACAEHSHSVSQDGLEVAPVPETGPVLQNLFFLWPWCQLSPSLVMSIWLLPSLGGGAVGLYCVDSRPVQAMQTGAALHPEAEGALRGSGGHPVQLVGVWGGGNIVPHVVHALPGHRD